MRHVHLSPAADLVIAVILFILGLLLFIYRREIGEFTGYHTGKFGYVDKPTPGWLLIPFAVALMVMGIIVVARTVIQLCA